MRGVFISQPSAPDIASLIRATLMILARMSAGDMRGVFISQGCGGRVMTT